MTLTLEVASPHASSLGAGRTRVFTAQGGTIGRAASNDWILSHRKVSGRHALITYQSGTFYIVDDSSANGVFLNSVNNRLVPGKRYALKPGDRIIIDPYEIDVSIGSERGYDEPPAFGPDADAPWSSSGELDQLGIADPFASSPIRTPAPRPVMPPPAQSTPAGMVGPNEEVDPLKLLEGSAPPPRRPPSAPSASDLQGGSVLSGHYSPPAVKTPPPQRSAPRGPFEIPADYDPLRDDSDDIFSSSGVPVDTPPAQSPVFPVTPRPEQRTPPPSPVPQESPRPQSHPEPPPQETSIPVTNPVPHGERTPPPLAMPPPPTPPPVRDAADPGLAAVLEGAGLERAPVTAEFARSFGRIFRVVVSGVMDVLRARQQIKDEFRMRMTQFRPADNNPLKFSANVDDALHNLLVKRNPAYLEPVEAFEDAFDDLRQHQLAMLAGMRVAFESMLAQFDPDTLQAQFDRQVKRSSLLALTARMQYWDLFRERQQELAKDPEAAFRRLFGDEFARAYEEQLQRLKAETRARRQHTPPPGE